MTPGIQAFDAVATQLARVRASTAAIAEVELPKLFGAAAKAEVQARSTIAGTEAAMAVATLDEAIAAHGTAGIQDASRARETLGTLQSRLEQWHPGDSRSALVDDTTQLLVDAEVALAPVDTALPTIGTGGGIADSVRAVVARADRAGLDPNSARQLRSLLFDTSAGRALDVPREMHDTRALKSYLDGIVSGEYTSGGNGRMYLARIDAALDPRHATETGAAEAVRELASRGANASERDLGQLWGIVYDSPGGRHLRGPRELSEVRNLDQYVQGIARGEYTFGTNGQRYLAEWTAALTPDAEATARVRQLLASDPASLSKGQLVELRRLSARGSMPGPSSQPGVREWGEYLDGLISGEYTAGANGRLYFSRWRTAFEHADTPAEQVASRLHELASGSFADFKANAGEFVGLVYDTPGGRSLNGPRSMSGVRDLDAYAQGMLSGEYEPGQNAGKYLAGWRVATDPEFGRSGVVTDRVRDIVSRQPGELAMNDWQDLRALLYSTDEGRGLGGPRQMSGVRDLDGYIDGILSGEYTAGPNAARYFDGWFAHLLPDRVERIQSATSTLARGGHIEGIDARVLAGTSNAELRSLGIGEDDVRTAISWRLAEAPAPTTPDAARSLLDDASFLLRADKRGAEGQLENIADEALQLVDRNTARIGGHTPRGAIQGYSNHPDYAEVGRVREQATLVHRLRDLERLSTETAPAAEGTGAAAAAAEGMQSAAPTAAGEAGETLSW